MFDKVKTLYNWLILHCSLLCLINNCLIHNKVWACMFSCEVHPELKMVSPELMVIRMFRSSMDMLSKSMQRHFLRYVPRILTVITLTQELYDHESARNFTINFKRPITF